MTKSDRWKQRPSVMRYWAFKDDLHKVIQGNLEPRFSVVFRVAMPKSWTEKVKVQFDGKPHQVKPDVDNYLKAFMDALCS
jgi:Holliday junction resolvase RusA-like endonuclease